MDNPPTLWTLLLVVPFRHDSTRIARFWIPSWIGGIYCWRIHLVSSFRLLPPRDLSMAFWDANGIAQDRVLHVVWTLVLFVASVDARMEENDHNPDSHDRHE